MQVSIETTEGLERKMTVGIPAEQLDGEVEKRLKEAAKTIQLNGFRRGKVPLKVVKQRFGSGVRQEVMGDLINKSFPEAVQQQELKPAGQPSIEPKESAEGSDFEYVATFEVYPEVKLNSVEGFEITKLNAEVTDEDLAKMLDILRKQQASWIVVERAAKDEDKVVIDFEGTKDGEAFEGGTATGQDLILGSDRMIPGFEDGVVGMTAGEEKVLSLTFPEDYHAEELKGAAVEFKVTVQSVNEQELPELNAEFFKNFGTEAETEEAFNEEVKSNMERELKNAAKNKLKTQVMDKLVDAHEVELPKALVAGEVKALRQQTAQQFGGNAQGLDLDSLLPDTMFQEQAERRVALGLVVSEVVQDQEIKVDGDKVKEMVDEIASTYQQPEDVVNYYYGNEQLLAGVESVVLEDQVVDYVISKSKVEEKESTYEEVIKPAEE